MKDDIDNPLGDEFDRMMRRLTGLPDTIHTQPSNVTTITPLIGLSQTWIIQTYRRRDRGDGGGRDTTEDIIFLQNISAAGSMRVVVPPAVANAIARQRDALTTKSRRIGAKQAVQTRADRGIKPTFKKKAKA